MAKKSTSGKKTTHRDSAQDATKGNKRGDKR